jgi:hypothetical protein|eukprot:COSAG06_NODE_1759_length_8453_cov_3.819129_6_plen_84_part_00
MPRAHESDLLAYAARIGNLLFKSLASREAARRRAATDYGDIEANAYRVKMKKDDYEKPDEDHSVFDGKWRASALNGRQCSNKI